MSLELKVRNTTLTGLLVIEKPVRKDPRGTFTRLYGQDELEKTGINISAKHVNTSTSTQAGTLRGIHFQFPPFAETKVVSCTSGALWDVGIDLRPRSPTRFKWHAELLTPDNGLSLVIPAGFGHAFLTMEPNTTAVYIVSEVYSPQHEFGLRFDDPKIGISWPRDPQVLSDKDQSWGYLDSVINELSIGFSSIE